MRTSFSISSMLNTRRKVAHGTITMPNWFLLEDAVTGRPRRDWADLAGPGWQDRVRAYAQRLTDDPRLMVTWSISPPLGIAVRTT